MNNKSYRNQTCVKHININEVVEPVDPPTFSDFVRDRILDLQPAFVFPEPMLKSFRIMCSAYNEATLRNIYNREPSRILIPSPTGAGKSVSARAYLSLAGKFNYSGLLVVPKVREAIDAVKDINKLAGNDISSCTYSISKDHPDCPERCSPDMAHQHRVLVITHRMFNVRSQVEHRKARLQEYDSSSRQCVIIDEKINFQETVALTTSAIREMVFYVSAKSAVLSGKGLLGTERQRKKHRLEDKENRKDIAVFLLELIFLANGHRTVVSPFGSRDFRFSKTNDITNKFGSCCVLDATLDEDLIADAHELNRDDVKLIAIPDGVRNYRNVTFHDHEDKQRRQGKGFMVYGTSKKSDRNALVDEYLGELYPIAEDGKLLVITFLALIETFRKRCKKNNIEFIHWGVHDSRNDLLSFTKVAIIGWNRYRDTKPRDDINGITRNKYVPIGKSKSTDIQAMIRGAMVSSCHQGLQRSASRVCINEYGDCCKVDVYIYDDLSSDSPIEDLVYSMKNSVVEKWTPVTQSKPIKPIRVSKNKSQKLTDRIINWLLNKNSGCQVPVKDIAEYFSTTPSAIKQRITKNKYFGTEFEKAGLTYVASRGNKGVSFVVVPESQFEAFVPGENDGIKNITISDLFNSNIS